MVAAWLLDTENVKRLLLESGVLGDSLARFRRWWRLAWGGDVDLCDPESWFSVEVEERAPVPVLVGWPEAPVVVDVRADAVVGIRWRCPAHPPAGWAEAVHANAFHGTPRVFIRVESEIENPDQTLATLRILIAQGVRPWLILTGLASYVTHVGEFAKAGAVLWRIPESASVAAERS